MIFGWLVPLPYDNSDLCILTLQNQDCLHSHLNFLFFFYFLLSVFGTTHILLISQGIRWGMLVVQNRKANITNMLYKWAYRHTREQMHRYVSSPAVVGLHFCDCLVWCDLESQMTCLVMVWNMKCMGQLPAYLCVLNYKHSACKLKLYIEAEHWRLGGSLALLFLDPRPKPCCVFGQGLWTSVAQPVLLPLRPVTAQGNHAWSYENV